jgi:hypothetical protein
MATKREDIEKLISKTMEGRDITASVPAEEAQSGVMGPFTPPAKRQVQIRFDPGDYETLQRIAYRKGTKASALIRQAVKDIIRQEGGNSLTLYQIENHRGSI